jgi:hypothetical protein
MVLPQETIYIRVKRKNQTFFVLCTPTEKVMLVKYKIAKIIDHNPNWTRLLQTRNGTTVVIQDDANLRDQNIDGSEIIELVLSNDGSTFESPAYDVLTDIAPAEATATA